ncbi:MAG: nucleotide-binding protein [bacterium]|nr:nucleotide-binding protein [bacterium]
MLENCDIAVIVMSAEDETSQGTLRARQNVIHEIGLFQGKYGFEKVFIFKQSGIEGFSNITGLQTVNFSSRPEDGFYELERAINMAFKQK